MKTLAVCTLLALACSAPLPSQDSSKPQESAKPPQSARQNEQVKAADIRGSVTHVAPGEIKVEALPNESHGAKAVVKVTNDTIVRDANGQTIAASAIRVGQTVSVWFDGAVAQSYPLQATASEITVE